MQGELTHTAGCALFCISAIVLSILGVPGIIRIFLLAAAWIVLDYLHCRQFLVVYRFYRILEAPGGRSQLSLADQGRLCRAHEETRVYCRKGSSR